MEFSAKIIADLLSGTVEGDETSVVTDLAKIEEGRSGTLTFLANPAYTDYIYSTQASIAIVPNSFKAEKPIPKSLTLVRVEDPRMAFTKILEAYSKMVKPTPGIHKSAVIDETSNVDSTAFIGPMVVIEGNVTIGAGSEVHAHCFIGKNVSIGSNSILHQRVNIGHDCVIGNDCMIQPSAVVGGDGFGFAPNNENQYQKVVHVGNVILEDHVEIGANTTIDRATLGSTLIRKGVKLDNLIQIAHNVEIGENTVIAAQTGVAGSTKIGKNCMIGGQVGIVGHLVIADEVKIAAQSGIGNNITEKGMIVQGSPAMPIRDFKKAYVHFRKLDQLADRVDKLDTNTPKLEENG